LQDKQINGRQGAEAQLDHTSPNQEANNKWNSALKMLSTDNCLLSYREFEKLLKSGHGKQGKGRRDNALKMLSTDNCLLSYREFEKLLKSGLV
jgi:hypothetical protein